jgi:hypothetical protein
LLSVDSDCYHPQSDWNWKQRQSVGEIER